MFMDCLIGSNNLTFAADKIRTASTSTNGILNPQIDVGNEVYVQHDENNNNVYDLKKDNSGTTTIYKLIFPKFTANKGWRREGFLDDNREYRSVESTDENGETVKTNVIVPWGATGPDDYIPVKADEKYFIKTYGVGGIKTDSTETPYIWYTPVLFLDDANNKIADMLTNTMSASKKGVIIEVPENATKMHITMYNNQGFTLQKELNVSNEEFDKLTINRENFEKQLKENYESYKTNQTLLREPDKGYITFVNDDIRPCIDIVADIFTEKKVPLVIAAMPDSFMENSSRQTETRLQSVQRLMTVGSELMAHNGLVLTEEGFSDYNTMFSIFVRTKQIFNNYGFDVNGIILSGGTGQVVGRAESEEWCTSIYGYSDLYGTKYTHEGIALGSAYYHYRGGLGNYKNDMEKMKAAIDDTIANKNWSVFYFHDFSEISEENLKELIDYAKSKSSDELEIATYKQIYDKLAVREQDRIKEIKNGNGVVTFTMDDAYKDAYTIVKDKFDKYGFKGSVAVRKDYVQKGTAGNASYLSESEIKELYDSGWEIIPHGLDSGINQKGQSLFIMPSEEGHISHSGFTLEQELVEGKSYVESIIGRGNVKGFAIPNLSTRSEYIPIMKKWYKYALGTCDEENDFVNDRIQIRTLLPISNQPDNEAETLFNKMKSEIDEAIYLGKKINIYFHLTDTFTKQINWSNYDCNEQALDKILAYVYEKQKEGVLDVKLPCETYCDDTPLPEVKSTVYYVSADGTGDGLSEKTPMSYEDANKKKFLSGDIILFKKGDTFYGSFNPYIMKANDKVTTISAYGEGPLPVISGYKIADNIKSWELYSDGIYKIDLTNTDNFNGMKTTDANSVNIGFMEDKNGVKYYNKKDALTSLIEENDFYCDTQYLYVKSAQNPYSKLGSLKLATKTNLVSLSSNLKLSNLNIKGTGAHGVIYAGTDIDNAIISDNIIEDIGGSYLNGTTRYGNGIEFYGTNASNITVERNIIKNVYDVGFTMQGTAGSGKDVEVKHNLFVANTQDSEIWESGSATGINGYQFSENVSVNQGRGWGYEARPDKYVSAHILFWGYVIENTDIYFHNNFVYNPIRIYFIEQTNKTNIFFKEQNLIKSDYNTYYMNNSATIFRDSYKIGEKDTFIAEYKDKDTHSTFNLLEDLNGDDNRYEDPIVKSALSATEVYDVFKLFGVTVDRQPELVLDPEPVATEQPDIVATEQPDIVATKQPDIVATKQPDIVATEQPDIVATEQPDIIATEQPDIVATKQPESVATEQSYAAKPIEDETPNDLAERITTTTTIKKRKGAGNYEVIIYVKDGDKVIKKSVEKFCIYNKLKAKSLITSEASSKAKVGNKIKLTAKATGGGGSYQYKFAYKYKTGKYKIISKYGTKPYTYWVPNKAGTYTLRVTVYDKITKKNATYTKKYDTRVKRSEPT